jgi:hypothetical protein
LSRLFDRRASVIFERKREGATLLPDTELVVQVDSPLRIQFKIEKHPFTPPNTAEITLTNLSRETRRSMEVKSPDIVVRAGYASGPLTILFQGQARTVDHVRTGSEWNTRIQCGDGETAYRFAQATGSWQPGTSASEIAGAIADQLGEAGVDVTRFKLQLKKQQLPLVKEQFAKGYAVQGSPLQELEKLLQPGTMLSIQSGELQAIPLAGANDRDVFRLSADSGLLGSPEHGSPDQNGLESVLKVASLLLPQMNPGDPFVVDGENIKGVYRAEKVVHVGDTHGSDWKTEIEGRELPGWRVKG